MKEIKRPESFDWDQGNADKNWDKHNVNRTECEEAFFNAPLFIEEDPKHSVAEKRYFAMGQTFGNRRIAVVFTLRGGKIRPISARDMSRKERDIYEKAKKDSGF